MLTGLAASGLHIPITPGLLLSLAALLIAVWAVYSLILRYHWKNYGVSALDSTLAGIIYIAGSLVLIALMLAALGFNLFSSV